MSKSSAIWDRRFGEAFCLALLSDLRSIVVQFVSNAPILDFKSSYGLILLSDHSVTGAYVDDPFGDANLPMKNAVATSRLRDMISPNWRVRITVPDRVPYRFRLGVQVPLYETETCSQNLVIDDWLCLYARNLTTMNRESKFLSHMHCCSLRLWKKYGVYSGGYRTFGWGDSTTRVDPLQIPLGERFTIWEFRADLSNNRLALSVDGKQVLQNIHVPGLPFARPLIELALPETTATFEHAD